MPRYFFHLRDGAGCEDEEGAVLTDEGAARQEAIRSARSIIAAELLKGRLLLDDHIIVTDEDGKRVLILPFRDAFTIEG